MGFGGGKGFIQGSDMMGVEVIADQFDLTRVGIIFV